MADDEKSVKLPEENICNASGFIEKNTTLPVGDKGSIEELDKILEKDPKIKKI